MSSRRSATVCCCKAYNEHTGKHLSYCPVGWEENSPREECSCAMTETSARLCPVHGEDAPPL